MTKYKTIDDQLSMLYPASPIANHVASSIIVTGMKGEIKYVNLSVLNLLGYSLDELLGQNISIMNDPKFTASKLQIFKKIISENHFTYELNPRTKSGKELTVEIHSEVMSDYGGERAIVHTVNDITEKRALDEIAQNAMVALEKESKLTELFMSVITHDLRSPLTAILGFSGLILDPSTVSVKEIKKYATYIESSALAQTVLLKKIAEYRSSQSEGLEANYEFFEVKNVVNEVVDLCRPQAILKGIDIISEIDDRDKVYADHVMLGIALRNLVDNAVKFTSQHGQIRISGTKVENKKYKLIVKDDGVGMDSYRQQNLFNDDKIKSTKGTNGEGGTGLGLLSVKNFMKLNGGSVEVVSNPGKGSEFSLYILRAPIYK
ncbi:MAG: PAS domain-containing sensor histidine kinase [Candidatus Nanoarchaeia archaeon]